MWWRGFFASLVFAGTVWAIPAPPTMPWITGPLIEDVEVVSSMAFPSNTTLLDDFNRSDGAAGSNWPNRIISVEDELEIFSNEVFSGGTSDISDYGSSVWITSFNADQEFHYTLSGKESDGSWVGVWGRVTDPETGSVSGYALYVNALSGTDEWSIWECSSASLTQIGASVTQEISAGDLIGFELIGSTLKGYINTGGGWTEVISRTDSTHTGGGQGGLQMSGWDWLLDDFTGGNVASGGVTVTPNAVALTFAVPQPTLTVGTVINTPNPAVVTFITPQPTLTPGEVTVSPNPAVIDFSVPNPSVVMGEATVTPDSVVLEFNVPEPTITVTGTNSPDPVVFTFAVPNPSFTMGAVIVTPDSVVLEFTVPNPSISDGTAVSTGRLVFLRRRRRM